MCANIRRKPHVLDKCHSPDIGPKWVKWVGVIDSIISPDHEIMLLFFRIVAARNHLFSKSKVGWGTMGHRGTMGKFHFKVSRGRTKGNSRLSRGMDLN